MASVTITGPAEVLDQLTDELGREPDIRTRRLALEQLEPPWTTRPTSSCGCA
jgi:hypothetical protein